MQLILGEEGLWEACTPLLSPLEEIKSLPDPFKVLGHSEPWQLRTDPFEYSDSEQDSDSDDGTASTASSQILHSQSEVASPVDWGDTETFKGNALSLEFAPGVLEVRAVAPSTPQAESLRAPSNHQDVRNRERPNPECPAPGRHATPKSYVTASKTLVMRGLQDIGLRGGMDDASGLKRSQGACKSPRQKSHPYVRAHKPRRNYEPEDWLSSGDPTKRVDDDDVLSTCAVYAEEERLVRAPLLCTVPLPGEENEASVSKERLLYGGPDLGGWLTGTFDGVSKMLSHLDFALPVPFPADECLLAFPAV